MEESPAPLNSHPEMRFGRLEGVGSRIAAAIDAAQEYLFSTQQEEGHWCGELEADTTLEAEYVLMHTLLGTGDPVKFQKACRWMFDHQNEDGGWPVYHGGPSEISATVVTYFALKICGYGIEDLRIARARECIEQLGGPTKCNTYIKIYLCFFGQYEWWAVPAIPPEIVLFPKWFWFNIYEISSWSRAIFIPLAIVYARKPFKKLSPEQGIQELFPGGDMHNVNLHLAWDKRIVSWRNFFLLLNNLTHFFERVHIRPLRSIALRAAKEWMLERFEMSDGLGAIYPGIMNSIIALRCLGYSVDDPQFIRALDEFEALGIEEKQSFRMQPCKSPVWDTVYAIFALGESGVSPKDPRMVAAADWVLKKQITHKGDWAVKVKNTPPGGWYFEFNNEFYPDVDDSGMVNLALSHVEHPNERYQHDSIKRAIDWIFAMQCRNGGWASFDKDNTRMVFQYIPFADHNAMLDPPTVDITGRMLEMLAAYGYTKDDLTIQRAIRFILDEQEADGSWFGRWGCNYIYGTSLVLRGMDAIGIDNHEPHVQQAAEWLRSIQNSDGGWGESMGSYDDPRTRGQGESTASQTAWAIMGLLAAGDTRSDSVARGVAYLLRTQQANGTWQDGHYTGTGFPRVFYLKYHMYAQYFPLIALATYARVMTARDESTPTTLGRQHL